MATAMGRTAATRPMPRDAAVSAPRFPPGGAWIAGLLQAADSMYPTGSYAQSFGLEGLTQEGAVRDRPTLRAFLLEQALPALARTDLALTAQAWAAAAPPPDWDRLAGLCALAAAVRGAREPREASEAVGRQRCELAARLRGGLAAEFNRRAEAGRWPRPACVAAAIEARTLGAPVEAALAGQIYAAAAGLIAAAVKLLRLGQNAAQDVLTACLDQAPALMATALALDSAEIGAWNPWWDLAAARHETAEFRLFIS
jgi:urease accessory protein